MRILRHAQDERFCWYANQGNSVHGESVEPPLRIKLGLLVTLALTLALSHAWEREFCA